MKQLFKKNRRVQLQLVLIVLTACIGLTYLLNNLSQKNLTKSQFPSAPAETPFEKINASLIHNDEKWTTNNTHDASIIKVNDWYYSFSTDYKAGGTPQPGIQIRKSKDLINWTFTGRVFEKVSDEAREWTNGSSTYWAPDIIEINGVFYLYYSVSEIGTRNSYIGVASSTSIEGPWQDQGEVLKTKDGDTYTVNAIDPAITIDEEGTPWMVYGSYFGGIFITEIDGATGKLKQPQSQGTLIAQRQSNDNGIEGPDIFYNPSTEMYYLTVSYGWLEDTYNLRVARSKQITGPYLDYNGKPMKDLSDSSFDTGTKIVNAYSFNNDTGWLGTGHNGLLQDNGELYLIHNARAGDDIYWSHLHVREIIWTEDGWPVASPERFAGKPQEKTTEFTNEQIAGQWETITLNRYDDSQLSSEIILLMENGKINNKKSNDYWEINKNKLTFYWYVPGKEITEYRVDTVTILPQWDWENWQPALVYTGLNQDGTAIWGKKIHKEE